jgi:hypothetical protein
MAYFANGCEGEVFDEQCAKCRFGESPCPIYYWFNKDFIGKIIDWTPYRY